MGDPYRRRKRPRPMIEQPKSQFRQLAEILRRRITDGEWRRGDRLPGEHDLAAQYGLSRHTVNQAVGLLRRDGLVRVERGKGAVVTVLPQQITRAAVARYQRPEREREQARGAFDAEIRRLGMAPHVEYRRVGRATPPAEVAALLGIDTGEQNALIRDRLMWADDVPVQIATTFIPWTIAEGTQLAEQDSGPGGIISRFAELGLAQTRVTERITVRTPSDEEGQFLELDPDQCVYQLVHTGWTADDQPVEVTVHTMPVALWRLDYEWPLD